MAENNVFRDGLLHVCQVKCSTCIYRPGNLMRLEPGRKDGMERDAVAAGGVIPCHQTLAYYRDDGAPEANAVCRGFFDTQKHNGLLAVAERMGRVKEVDPDA